MSLRYDQGQEIIEIIVRDSSGAKIETYKFKIADKRAGATLVSIMKKYGLDKDKDISWLKHKGVW